MSTAAITKTVITADEINDILLAQEYKAALDKKLKKAEEDLKKLTLALAEKTIGVRTAEELSKLSPEDIGILMDVAKENLIIESGAEFSFVKYHSSRNPSWKKEFIRVAGEAEAQAISNNTAESFSYKVKKDSHQ